MKHEAIDHKARPWVVSRCPTGRLSDDFDPDLLARLNPRHSAAEIADALVTAAGEMDVDTSRLW